MSYRALPHCIGGFVLFLLIPLFADIPASEGEAALGQPEAPAVAPAVESDLTEAVMKADLATNRVDQPVEAEIPPEPTLPAVQYAPPPPQVIQVQLPTMPVFSREDLELLVGRLAAIEQRLAEQQTNTTAMVVSSNESILTMAAILGGLGLVGVLGAAIVLVRAFNRFSDVMLTLPMGQQLGRGGSLSSLAMSDELHPVTTNALEQVSARFLGALEQLEKRVRELEVEPVTLHAGATVSSPGNGNPKTSLNSAAVNMPSIPGASGGIEPEKGTALHAAPNPESAGDVRRRILGLLEEGETLLQTDQYEEALSRFDEAIAIDPRHSEALIKRGMTLERLQRMDAALESYDRAIAANGSLTLAYLHKGAICNRLQRYREALECYERALQAEQKS